MHFSYFKKENSEFRICKVIYTIQTTNCQFACVQVANATASCSSRPSSPVGPDLVNGNAVLAAAIHKRMSRKRKAAPPPAPEPAEVR